MAIKIREVYDDPSRHHLKYTVDLNGKSIITTVTSAASVVRKWLRYTIHTTPHWARRNFVVGLGVQWVPKPSSTSPPTEAATIQLCVGCRCLIFQLARSPTVPLLLRRFLIHPNNTFVRIWNHSDGRNLERSRHGLRLLRRPLDLRHYARSKKTGASFVRASRVTIIQECLGFYFRFDKGVGRSDWGIEVLNEEQVLQATVDAHASFLIGKDLKAWNLNWVEIQN